MPFSCIILSVRVCVSPFHTMSFAGDNIHRIIFTYLVFHVLLLANFIHVYFSSLHHCIFQLAPSFYTLINRIAYNVIRFLLYRYVGIIVIHINMCKYLIDAGEWMYGRVVNSRNKCTDSSHTVTELYKFLLFFSRCEWLQYFPLYGIMKFLFRARLVNSKYTGNARGIFVFFPILKLSTSALTARNRRTQCNSISDD